MENIEHIKNKVKEFIEPSYKKLKNKIKLYKKYKNKFGYESLSPKENLNTRYFKAINYSMKNKSIKNVAISGPYGAGKSSIIKSYFKKYKRSKSLNISIAYFKKQDGQPATDITTQEIEKYILKQMFYQIKHSKVPYSRYRRINNLKILDMIKVSTPYLLSILTYTIIFNNNKFNSIKDEFIIFTDFKNIAISRLLIELGFIISTIIALIYTTKYLTGKLKISSIKLIKDVEISSKENSPESVFNKDIDEIIYFFEVGKFDVVVFEDIDRFNNIEIFVKLRELNDLINNSKQINRHVTFIYAIKDDMFKDPKERTKFFDFIIPIVPVVDSSNSKELIKEKLEINNIYNCISKDLVNKIAVYVDDMRMLINIYNEFIIYKEHLIDKYKSEECELVSLETRMSKLFAMIVYKNIHPKDFGELLDSKGKVYKVFSEKEFTRKNVLEEINNEIKQIEYLLSSLEKEHILNIEELRLVYIQYLNINKSVSITINGSTYNYDDFIAYIFDENSDLDANVRYYTQNSNYENKKLEAILTSDNTKKNYLDRKKVVELHNEENRANSINRLNNLRNTYKKVSLMNIQELIEEFEIKKILNEEIRENSLIVYLIKSGYIAEDYTSYTSYFYEGSLTLVDKEFIHSIDGGEALAYNYRLKKIENIVETLSLREFLQPEILNYDIVDFILSNRKKKDYQQKYENILKVLISERVNTLEFIDGYIDICSNIECFINSICKIWATMWYSIEFESNYTEDKKDRYLEYILVYANIDDIKRMNENKYISEYISRKNNFITCIYQHVEDRQKIKGILVAIDVKFENLDLDFIEYNSLLDKSIIKDSQAEGVELVDYIFNNNLYKINYQMIKLMIDLYVDYNFDLDGMKSYGRNIRSKNYTMIKKSNCEELTRYIDENIKEYLSEVFLNIESNVDEEEKYILELLQNENIAHEYKEKIIEKQNVHIYDINEVDKALLLKVVEERKFIVDWYNIIMLINETDEVMEETINLLNDRYIYKELSKGIEEGFEIEGERIKKLCTNIIFKDNISNDSIKYLSLGIKDVCNKYLEIGYLENTIKNSLNDFDKERVHIFIENNLINLNVNIFNTIKEHFSDQHIFLLEKNISTYIDYLEEYILTYEEFDILYKSQVVTKENRERIINKIDNEYLKSYTQSIKDKNLEESLLFLQSTFEFEIDEYTKLTILNEFIEELDNEEIKVYLEQLGGEYIYILEKGKQPILENNEENIKLLESLKDSFVSSYSIEDDEIKVNRKKNISLQPTI